MGVVLVGLGVTRVLRGGWRERGLSHGAEGHGTALGRKASGEREVTHLVGSTDIQFQNGCR